MYNYITISKFLYDFNSNSLNENRYELNRKIIKTAKRLEYLDFLHSKKVLKESYKAFLSPTPKNLRLRNLIRSRNKNLYIFLSEIKRNNYNSYEFFSDLKNLSLSDSRESFKICEIEFPITKNLNENLLISQTKKVEGLFEIFDTLKKGWDLVVGGFKRVYGLIKTIWNAIKQFMKINPNKPGTIKNAVKNSIKVANNEAKINNSISKDENIIINKIFSYTTNVNNIEKIIKNPSANSSPISLLNSMSNSIGVSKNVNEAFSLTGALKGKKRQFHNNEEFIEYQNKLLSHFRGRKLDVKNRDLLLKNIENLIKQYNFANQFEIINDIKELLEVSGQDLFIMILLFEHNAANSLNIVSVDPHDRELYAKSLDGIKEKIAEIIKPFVKKHPYLIAFLQDAINKYQKFDPGLAGQAKAQLAMPVVQDIVNRSMNSVKSEQSLIEQIGMFFAENAINIAIVLSIGAFIYFIGRKIYYWRKNKK